MLHPSQKATSSLANPQKNTNNIFISAQPTRTGLQPLPRATIGQHIFPESAEPHLEQPTFCVGLLPGGPNDSNNSKQHCALAKIGNTLFCSRRGCETFSQQPFPGILSSVGLARALLFVKAAPVLAKRSLQQSHFRDREHIGFLVQQVVLPSKGQERRTKKKDGREMLVAIALEKPLAEVKELVENPPRLIAEIMQILEDKPNEPHDRFQ